MSIFKQINNTGTVICYQQKGLEKSDFSAFLLHPDGTNEYIKVRKAAIMTKVLGPIATYINLVTFSVIEDVIYIHANGVGDAMIELITERFKYVNPTLTFKGVL